MKILLAHNFYQQPGGEDRVFADEAALLERDGHHVFRYCAHNDRVSEFSRLSLAAKTVWNRAVYTALRSLIREVRPDVCHFHNTFPLISPSAFYAAKAEGVPVVLTLHNFRLLCPGATFLRDGVVCQDCKGKSLAWPAVAHACYRNNRGASATVALMLFAHRLSGTWVKAVDRYIVLTESARDRFVEGGIPAARIVVKPNFIYPDPGFSTERSNHALFVGRLSPEKGIDTMLEAWRMLDSPISLRIAGDGPLAQKVRDAAGADPRIQWLGHLSADRVADEMRHAYCLLMPSIWFEGGLPLTALQAFASGLPVLASRIGAMAESIWDGDTGIHFAPGNARELAERVRACWDDPERMARLGRRCREEFLNSYSAGENLRQLLRIYQDAGSTIVDPQLQAIA